MSGNTYLRVDDRFIHGQVIHKWVDFLAIERIIVADDNILKNAFFCNTIRIAKPEAIELKIIGFDEIQEACDPDHNTLILVRDLTASRQVTSHISVNKVLVGRLPAGPAKKKVADNFYLSQSDVDMILEMADERIQIMIQVVPDQEPLDLVTLIKEI